MKHTIFKKIGLIALSISLVGAMVGCGKKNGESGSSSDPQAAVRDEVVNFVNQELVSISADRDDAVAAYNAYSTSADKDPQTFLNTLNTEAIPKMTTFVNNLTAIETKSDEVANLKNLYLQGSQKQLDAMTKVASAIAEENPDYLTEADGYIAESKDFFNQYESALRLLSVDYGITINGSFSSDGAATGEGSIEAVPAEGSIEAVPVE